VELEEVLRKAREKLRTARERKVEEVSVSLDFQFMGTGRD